MSEEEIEKEIHPKKVIIQTIGDPDAKIKGKKIRREQRKPRDSIDKIRVVAVKENSLEITCRLNRKSGISMNKTLRIPLPPRSLVKGLMKAKNKDLSDDEIETKTNEWLGAHVANELKKFHKKGTQKRTVNIKVPEEIQMDGEPG